MSCFQFDGNIREIEGISVDSFQDNDFKRGSTFFLSHCHSDHMVNLIDGFTKHIPYQPDLELHCTVMSSIILKNKFAHSEEASYVLDQVLRPLREDEPTFIRFMWNRLPAAMKVTAIPAKHCVGSCMFLFRFVGKNVLYTGNFRLHEFELEGIDALHDEGDVLQLDKIYLDTTFLKLEKHTFPTRKWVLSFIFNEIDNHLEETDGEGVIHIFRPSFLGSEMIIRAVARKYKCKIHVEWNVYKQFRGMRNVIPYITYKSYATNIHMCRLDRSGHNNCCNQPNVLKLHPSALWYANSNSTNWVRRGRNNQTVHIAHSMHCSRKELEAFIGYFGPTQMTPLVVPEGFTMDEIQEEVDNIQQEVLD
ncbi:protein artemis-like isoform X2 [Neocloeon triangulifer]|uniref:protein artemis-like isoform X2 n=1 Tax=Neocloeon triangulifer TaxID=2078957 RepID=UPI00286EEDF4|nr:protein artemis-like isoform X2 [Neocloeon triangulifer]